MSKEVILTGIRSNDEPTLGNYLGAIEPIVRMAHEKTQTYQINMFVPDLHSFTTPINHDELYNQTIDNLRLFIAAGLPVENESVYIYRQSYIPAHSELAWILSCFTGFGEASRMVEFKDKSSRLSNERVSVGLFNYPILMAADILLYGAQWVPVGEDQRQHLELARLLAQRMNNQFNNDKLFVIPNTLDKQQKFIDRDSAPRILSLKNTQKKMSKSIADPSGTILLSDEPEAAAKKVMSATTDSVGVIHYDTENQPGISNLLLISSLLTKKPISVLLDQWEGKSSYGDFKTFVAEQVREFLSELQQRKSKILETDILSKLSNDEEVMNKVANDKLLEVQLAVGLRRRR